MKIIYILLAGLCLLSCEKTKIEDVIREVEPEQPSSIHYYYSYKAGEVINAEKLGYASGEFMPGCTYIYGDTLFIANTQSSHFSVELYSLSAHHKKSLAGQGYFLRIAKRPSVYGRIVF